MHLFDSDTGVIIMSNVRPESMERITTMELANQFIEAQIAENMDEWTMKKSQMHAESRRIFEEAQKNNPENTCPTLIYTTEEKEDTEMIRKNIDDYVSDQEMAFVTGIGSNINNPADWNAFLAKLDELGLAEFQTLVQTAYERQ